MNDRLDAKIAGRAPPRDGCYGVSCEGPATSTTMEDGHWRAITARLAAALAPRGFDLVHPFRASWWDEAVEPAERLPALERAGALAVLIGNTRALWPRFRAALEREPARRERPDPLDAWVEEVLGSALAAAAPHHLVRFAHAARPRHLPIQRLAERAGFASLSSGRLSAHPEYGPWFALRAVAVLDVDGPEGPAPVATAPCAGCAAPCREAFERALAAADARADPALLHERWRPWLAVRDACPVGREWRYSDEQILYHYARRWS